MNGMNQDCFMLSKIYWVSMNDLTMQLHIYLTLQNECGKRVKEKKNRKMFKKKKKEQKNVKFDKKRKN
jgi:hypothetical protein